MMTAVAIAICTVGLMVLNELFRRSRIVAALVFIAVPLVMTPHWLHTNSSYQWFLWAKLYSVMIGVTAILLDRFTSLGKNAWASRFLWVVLLVNIVEAVVQDALSGGALHYLNALSGVLLILALPSPHAVHVDEGTPTRDLLWDMEWGWIIGYTIWNWVFVYLNFAEAGARHVAILAVPLIATIVLRKAVWLQTRAFILGVDLLVKFSYPSVLARLSTPDWYHESLAMVAVGLGVAVTGGHLVRSRLASMARRAGAQARSAA